MGIRRIAIAVLALCLGFLSCLDDPTPLVLAPAEHEPDGPRARETVAQWYLTTRPELSPRIEYLADLPSSLLAHGVRVQSLPGCEFRLDSTAWIRTRTANRAAYLKPVGPIALTEMPDTLTTFMGLADDSLAVEVMGGKEWLEALTGRPCPTFAYPEHEHDRRGMEFVQACGYLAARDGYVSRCPWGAFLLGPTGADWLRTWDTCSLWELPLLLFCADVQAQDPAAIAAWLDDPARLPLWKTMHSWVQLYTHTDNPAQTGTDILDTEHLAALLDALLADADVWIAPVGEAAAFLRDSHSPGSEPLVWELAVPTSAGERSGPWRGRACAFSFSTDDGFKSNLTSYAPVFAARGLAYTAYLNPSKIVSGDNGSLKYMSSNELLAFLDLGMEYGNHSWYHRRVLSERACLVSAGRAAPGSLHLEIASVGDSVAVLRLLSEP